MIGKGIRNGDTCDCNKCKFKGMSLCEYRKYIDAISSLRIALLISNQVMGDIAADKMPEDNRKLILETAKWNNQILEDARKLIEMP